MSKSLGQHRRAVGRASTATAPTPSAGTSSPPSSRGTATVLDRDGRRVGAPVPAAAVEHVRLLRPLRERQRRRAERDAPAGRRPRPLGALAARGDGRDGPRARSTTTTRRAPATRSRRSSTTSRTGTCAARAGASGTATRPPSRRCAPASSRCRKLLAPFTPVHRRRDLRQPRRRRAERAPVATSRRPGARDAALESRWTSRARPCGSGSPRAGRPSSRCASRCARRSSSPPGAERAAIERLADVVLEELNVKELRFVVAGRRARLLRGQAQLPRARPALRQADAAGRRGGRGARPGARRRGAARRRARRHQRRRPRPRARRPTTCCSRCSRSTATSSSARARTPWRSSSSSTTSCAARGWRARSCTRSRTRARPRASQVEDRIELALGGDDELLAAAREHEDYVAGETLARGGRLRRRRRRRRGHHRRAASCGSRVAAGLALA